MPLTAKSTRDAANDKQMTVATASLPIAALEEGAAPAAGAAWAAVGAPGKDLRWLELAARAAALADATGLEREADDGSGLECWQHAATCTPAPDADLVASARAFALRTLQRWDAASRSDHVAAVVAEFAASALRQPGRVTAGVIEVGLLHQGSCVLCAVADSDSRGHARQQLAAALSDRWGTCQVPGRPGSVMWAILGPANRPPTLLRGYCCISPSALPVAASPAMARHRLYLQAARQSVEHPAIR